MSDTTNVALRAQSHCIGNKHEELRVLGMVFDEQ